MVLIPKLLGVGARRDSRSGHQEAGAQHNLAESGGEGHAHACRRSFPDAKGGPDSTAGRSGSDDREFELFD
jgi:hypothetical protein